MKSHFIDHQKIQEQTKTKKKITDAKMLEKHNEIKNRQKPKIQRDVQRKRMTIFWSSKVLNKNI